MALKTELLNSFPVALMYLSVNPGYIYITMYKGTINRLARGGGPGKEPT